MGDLEIMSPIAQSLLQWDKVCQEESVDNFDLSLSMGQESGEASYMDHTFHTPSFGDEEFDIPPIHLPPSTPSSSDTNSSDVYGSTQPLSHQDQQQPTQQNQTPNTNNNQQQQHPQQQQQQHMMSPPPHQMSPSPCSQSGLDRLGAVMTAVTTPTPSPPAMMTSSSFVGSPQQHMQQHQQHLQQHMQQQQYPQQQHQNDMYMLQIAPQGTMMPPQPMHFHVQQYAVPTGYMQHQHLQQHMHHPMQQQHPQQLLPPSPMLQLQLTRGGRPPSSSPPGSTHTSPGLALETSEDSDDSAHLAQLMCNGALKRPSPEPPCERPSSAGGKPPKKPKVQKKKKKRDPNEPQKPVSAYALFFRDTQAAIKGQNPNASFGEVSKIVASMWDSLDVDHKNVYKKKTEAAKKEYLKALAAYRASLVSKAANDQPPDSGYSGGGSMGGGGLSPLQKKSPLLTSLMEGAPQSAMQQQNMANQQQSMIMAQNQMGHHPQQQHMGQHPTHQMLHQMLSPPNGAQQQQMLHPHMMQQQQHHAMQHQMNNNNLPYAQNMQQPVQQGQHLNHGQVQQQPGMMQQQQCSRNDPSNNQQQEWDNREFCNNDCVVSHCRDVFTTWVAARPPQTSYASVK